MAERETPGRIPQGPGGYPRDPPPLSLPRKSSENLEKVPRIREGEGSRRSEILNPINNDHWVRVARPGPRHEVPRGGVLGASAA